MSAPQPPHPYAPGQPQHYAPGQQPYMPGAPDQQPSHAPGQPQRNGTAAWAIGFISYLPIPIFSVLIAGLVQFFVGRAMRRHGGVAAENGRRAANWGLTQVAWFVLALASVSPLIIGSIITGDPSYEPPTWMAIPAVVMLGSLLLIGILQLVYAIAGTVAASSGGVAKLPAIPFLRRRG